MKPTQSPLYLVISLFVITIVNAQIPGGVKGFTIWLESANYNSPASKIKVKEDSLSLVANYFNFNRVLDTDHAKELIYKNVVKDQYTFFAVFKADVENEEPVFTITKGADKINITSKAVLTENDLAYKKVDSRKGIIISFTSSVVKKGRKNNSIAIEDIFESNVDGKRQLMELLYYPRVLHKQEREKVETYLSIKYGLSIVTDFDYTNSANEKIWSYKTNKSFNNRVTGIGRDDSLNLYQKQSGNADKDGIYIGLGMIDTTNAKNPYGLVDKTYLLWGDNAGSTEMNAYKNNKDIKVMKRVWKMQSFSKDSQDSIKTQLRINKKEFALSNTEKGQALWLAINSFTTTKFGYGNAHYIKQSGEDKDFVYFNDIIWTEGQNSSCLFTFVSGPDFFVQEETTAECSLTEQGKIDISIAGGAPPYTLYLQNESTNQKYVTQATTYQLTTPLGNYNLTITDSKNRSQQVDVSLDAFESLGLSLAPVWVLDADKTVRVLTDQKGDTINNLTYRWNDAAGMTLSTSTDFIAKEEGNYILEVTAGESCKKQYPFKVASSLGTSKWSVYPNPTQHGKPFTIAFFLHKPQKVHININSMEGKSQLDKELGIVKNYYYTDSIITSGVYMVTVTIDNLVQSAKLIIE